MKTNPLAILVSCLLVVVQFNLCAQETTKKCSHTDIIVKEISAQKTLVIRAEVPMNSIGQKIGEMYGELYTYLPTQKVAPAAAPFAIYYSWNPEGNTVFEAGIPIAETVPGNDHIMYKEFPAMKVVSTLFTGSYEDFGVVYADIEKYIKENKIETTGQSWEVYLTDPSTVTDPSKNQTIIYFPVK